MALKLLLIGLFGGVGAISRYLLAGLVHGGYAKLANSTLAITFPLGTLFVNALGCLLIGVAAAVFAGPATVREDLRLAIMVGLLGGFTTFSTFGFETMQFINDGQFSRALTNLLLMNITCLAAVWIGYRITERIVGIA